MLSLGVTLGDLVWEDLNGDGVYTTNEPGRQGITVILHDGVTSNSVATNVTDSSGGYLFSNVVAGSYFVEVILPIHFFFSPESVGGEGTIDSDISTDTGSSVSFILNAGEQILDVDAGLIEAPVYFASNSIAVAITDVQILPNGMVMVTENSAIDNVFYNLEHKSDGNLLGPGPWLTIPGAMNLQSTSNLLSGVDPNPGAPPRGFYRFVIPDLP
ncbi:MAG: hypothetical protein GKR87_06075 [Kiritimatiellae bacterium]|nr:hypothetical protein [Kiritimatiellia bacterium]